jgi:hypothetical protein
MTSSFNAARLIAVGRRAIPWGIGATAWVMRGGAGELAAASACPGLLEFMSIAVVRLNPDLRIGHVFNLLQAVATVVALAAFVELAARRTRNLAVAAAAGLAVALSPLFARTLSPQPDAAAFGLFCAAALLATSAFARRSTASYALFGVGLAVCLMAALLVPPWLLVAVAGAFIAGAATWPYKSQRWIAGALAAIALALLVPAILNVSRPDVLTGSSSVRALTACTLPLPSPAATIAYARTVLWWLGPFALGLAALGASVELPRLGWRRSAMTALVALACLALAASAHVNVQVALAPLAVALWCLAAGGLSEVVTATGRGTLRRVAAGLFLLLLPALEASRRIAEERDDWVRPRGHETQTLRRTTTMLNLVAQNASFVEEDATVDLLLRASVVGGRRRGKPFTVVAARPDAVTRALADRTVYAFPHRQEDLSLRGFVVEQLAGAGPGAPAVDGIAEITGRRRCVTIGDQWADVTSASDRIALSADGETARGPVTIYFGGPAAAGPYADWWPPRTTRGFRFATFDQLTGARSARLQEEARDSGLPPDHPVLAAPFVIRLTLHRTPRAPLALPVMLGGRFPAGVAKLEPGGADAGHLTLCDAPAVPISPLMDRE